MEEFTSEITDEQLSWVRNHLAERQTKRPQFWWLERRVMSRDVAGMLALIDRLQHERRTGDDKQ